MQHQKLHASKHMHIELLFGKCFSLCACPNLRQLAGLGIIRPDMVEHFTQHSQLTWLTCASDLQEIWSAPLTVRNPRVPIHVHRDFPLHTHNLRHNFTPCFLLWKVLHTDYCTVLANLTPVNIHVVALKTWTVKQISTSWGQKKSLCASCRTLG